jgi:hypothetical protein
MKEYPVNENIQELFDPDLPNSPALWAVLKGNHSKIENAKAVKRLEFYENDPSSEILERLRKQLPPGFEICPINAQLFKRCEWREEMEFYAGGFDNFLKYGIGIYGERRRDYRRGICIRAGKNKS